ncbi:MAG: BrnT family toxin [Gammaproteobacteria bacterium]|nr:BrnT family toxin [Gammaproteobacteria bacterium]
MDIGFIWDNDKYREVQRKHRVQFYEVVSAFDDPNGFGHMGLQGHTERWTWIGSTTGMRILAIIYTEEDLPLYRLITAFDAGERLLNDYYRRSRI